MSQTHPHVVATPFFMLPLRGVQAILAIILLGLFAYLINAYNDFTGGYDGPGYILGGFGVGLWSTILTLIIVAYSILTPMFLPVIYNIFAALVLEALALIFWLSTWACLAKTTSELNGNGSSGSGGVIVGSSFNNPWDDGCDTWDINCDKKRDLGTRALHSFEKRSVNFETWRNVVYTSLAFSLIIWFIFIATTVFLVLSTLKHRRAGAPLMPGRTGTTAGPAAGETKELESQPMPATTTAPTYEEPAVQQPVLHQEPAAPMH